MKKSFIHALSICAVFFSLHNLHAQKPGGASGAGWWYKADAGVTGTTSVTSWNDQSGNARHLGLISGSSGTTISYNNGVSGVSANMLNFNPTVTFPNNTNTGMISGWFPESGDCGGTPGSSITTSQFVVMRAKTNGGCVFLHANGAAWGNSFHTTNFQMFADGAGVIPGAQSAGVPYLLDMVAPNPSTSPTQFVYKLNGQTIAASPSFSLTATTGGTLRVGHQGGGTAPTVAPFDGEIAEMFAFPSDQTGSRNKIESYLALKYGITLDQTAAQDYIASNGTTKMWTASGAGAYNKNICGIGRDDSSGLYQKISASVNPRAIATIATSNNFVLPNNDASRRAAFRNLEFISISDNSPASGNPTWSSVSLPHIKNILSSQWYISGASISGARDAYLQFNVDNPNYDVPALSGGSGAVYYLIVSNAAGAFTTLSTIIPLVNTGGSLWSTPYPAKLFSNNKFTLAEGTSTSPNPGGVRGAALWLNAGAGTSSTTNGAAAGTWMDQAGNYAYYSSGSPTYKSNVINFNPGILYNDGTNDHHEAWVGFGPAMDSATCFFIGTKNNNANDGYHVMWGKANAIGIDYYWDGLVSNGPTDNPAISYLVSGGLYSDINSTLNWPNGETNIYSSSMGLPNGSLSLNNGSAYNFSNTFITTPLFDQLRYQVVGNDYTSVEPFGTVGESIVYPKASLTATQKQQVSSYLALKYGVTLDQATPQDYLASDGTTKMWNAAGAGAFNKNIIGVGRDDSAGLYQKVSKSSNKTAIVTVATESDFASANSNASRNNILTNNQFLTIASNAVANPAWNTAGALIPLEQVLNTSWQVQNINGVSAVYLQFDAANIYWNLGVPAGAQLYLVYDNSGTILSTSTQIPLTKNGNLWSTSAAIAFSNNGKFTLAIPATAGPGGVIGESVWLKAGTGVTGTSNITAWADQAGNSRSVTGSTGPSLNNGSTGNNARMINYNPTHSFTTSAQLGSSSYLQTDLMAGAPQSGISNSQFIVYKKGATDGTLYNYSWGAASQAWSTTTGVMGVNNIKAQSSASINTNAHLNSLIAPVVTSTNSALKFYMDGKAPTYTTANALSGIGNGNLLVGNNVDADIAEIIDYPTDQLSSRNKIESYLALKYGISLDASAGNYVNSTGSNIYTIDAGFKNQVVGIARDDNSLFLQKQSHTTDDSLRLFINTLATSNAGNSGTISNDLSSIVMGHNGGKLKSVAGDSKPVTIFSRLNRVWKVTNNNFTDNFSIEVKWDSTGTFNINDMRLLVSDNPTDFTNAAVYSSYDVNFYIGSIIVTGINNSIIPANSTKYLTIGSASLLTPLGVQWEKFDVSAIDKRKVNLDWIVITDINSDHFSVERSANNKQWDEIGAVKASNSASFSFADLQPLTGVSYYRIKEVDKTGAYTYSVVRQVNIAASSNSGLIVLPNPFDDRLTIKTDASQLKNLRIYNIAGQDVSNLVKTISLQATSIVFDVSSLTPGAYFIKTDKFSVKVVKLPK